MKDRFKQILEHLGASAAEFADKLGVQRSAVSHILSGRNNPSLEFLQKVLTNYPQINPDWLLLGMGNITRDSSGSAFNQNEVPSRLIEVSVEAKKSKGTDVKEIKPSEMSSEGPSPEKILLLYPDGTFRVYISRNT
jgi:transcriptional regulator with XRE-family HTH domain